MRAVRIFFAVLMFAALCAVGLASSVMAAQFPNDDFMGTVLDTDQRWSLVNANGGTYPLNGGIVYQKDSLVFAPTNDLASSGWGVLTKYYFEGDFDVQVDFSIGAGWSSPASGHLDGAIMGVRINDTMYHLTRIRDPYADYFMAWTMNGGVLFSNGSTALSGKYRLVRNGAVLSFMYDFGSGWQTLGSIAVSTAHARIYVSSASIDAYQSFVTTFSNFIVNSGAVTHDKFNKGKVLPRKH